jgi:hypothetical protein
VSFKILKNTIVYVENKIFPLILKFGDSVITHHGHKNNIIIAKVTRYCIIGNINNIK